VERLTNTVELAGSRHSLAGLAVAGETQSYFPRPMESVSGRLTPLRPGIGRAGDCRNSGHFFVWMPCSAL
jgi:hypothetical protein